MEHRPDSPARKVSEVSERGQKVASTQELIQSWLSFSMRSFLGPGVFLSKGLELDECGEVLVA